MDDVYLERHVLGLDFLDVGERGCLIPAEVGAGEVGEDVIGIFLNDLEAAIGIVDSMGSDVAEVIDVHGGKGGGGADV